MFREKADEPSQSRRHEKDAVAAKFGANLRALRLSTPLSQAGLAKLSDIHITEVSLIERGKRVPRLDTLVRLVAALGVTANDLVDGIEWVGPSESLQPGFYDLSP